jgi:lipopolysaccharide transport system permease protein
MRYGRSKLGQAWLTISLFIQIMSTGIVWSLLWKMPAAEFLPYLAIGQTLFQFFSTVILDSTNIFVSDSRLYINQYLPFMTSTLSSIYRNTVIFLHNIPIIFLILLWFRIPVHFSFNAVLCTLPLLLFLISSSYVVACLCTRYRDLIQIVQSVMSITFLITPIVWQLNSIPETLRTYFYINPFTAFLEVYRNALLGLPINSLAYLSIELWTLFSLGLMIYTHQKYEKKIVFWI